jgi:AdoMet-dependent heme synthase
MMDSNRQQIGRAPERPVLGMYDYELRAPISVLIELTRRCNLRCLHCFANSGAEVQMDELSTSELKALIDRLGEIGVFLLFFGGGEPLCREDCLELAAYAKARNMDLCLLSNMTLINKDMASRLRDIGFYKIEGNLDGSNAETYESLRQMPGSFDSTLAGIRNCLEVGLPVRVNCTLTKFNVAQMEEIAALAASLGVNDLAFIRLIPAGRGDQNFERLDLGEPRYRGEVLPRLKHLRKRYAPQMMIAYEQDEAIVKANDPNQVMPWCGSGRIHCTITPEGYVKPDHSFPDQDTRTIAGNIRQQDFAGIWQQSPVFRKIRHTRFMECEGCEHTGCCGGDVYRIYAHWGELMGGRDPRCLMLANGGGYA